MPMRVSELTITRPDDWHLHLRDGEALWSVLPDSARRFARAIVMPNLKRPVTTTALARDYRKRILMVPLPKGSNFKPLMTLYLTDNTLPEEIDRAFESGFVKAVKYYPAGATTGSGKGVTDIRKCRATLERMEKLGMPLLIHGEVVDPKVDIFDLEKVFIDKVLIPLMVDHPFLQIVMEHITTREAVQFIKGERAHVGATITALHLLENRNAIFRKGLNPHNVCKPVLKREEHREALLEAATSGNSHFFLGTDGAPHAKHLKENDHGCSGCYTAPAAIELYAEAFDSIGKLDMLERFASFHGADFYGLPRNRTTITLVRKPWKIPKELPFGKSVVVPFRAGETVQWKMK